MTEGPTIDRSVVTPIIKSIETLGGDVETLIQDSGLWSSWSDVQSDQLPEANVWDLFERSAHALDLPNVGLRVGSGIEVRDLGPFGRQLENSLTTLTCLRQYIASVNRYSSHSKFWLQTQHEGAWFCRQGIDLIDVGRDHVEQFTLQLMIRLVRLGCGPRWLPSSIRIQATTEQFYREESDYDRVDISCQHSATSIWISSSNLLKAVRRDDDAIIRCVRDCVLLSQRHSRLTIHDVAQQLGFSVRTLQRELATHGLDWTRLLDQVRLDRAIELLSTDMPLAEIANELDYADAANFGRAFRRWTGTTPRTYRRFVNDYEMQ